MLGVLNGCGGRRRLSADQDQVIAGQSTRSKRNKPRIGVLPSCLGASSSTSAAAASPPAATAAVAAAVTKRHIDRFHCHRVPTPHRRHLRLTDGRPDVRCNVTPLRSKEFTSTLTNVVIDVPDNDDNDDASRRRQSLLVAHAADQSRFHDDRNFRHHYEMFADEDDASITIDSLEAASDEHASKGPCQLRRRRNDGVIVVHSRSSMSTISTAGATGNDGIRTAGVCDLSGTTRTVVATKTEVECRVRQTSFVAASTSMRDRRRLDASGVCGGGGAESSSTWWPDAALSWPRSELADSGYAGTTVVSGDRTDANGSRCSNDVLPTRRQSWIRDCTRLGRVTEECGDITGVEEDSCLLSCCTDVGLLSGVSWAEDISAGHVRISTSMKNDNTVRVSVQKTRKLRATMATRSATTLIQIVVVPSSSSSTNDHGRRVNIDNEGMLCDKFDVDLDWRDANSRLEISCWTRCNGGSEMSIGCMSFDINRLFRNTRQKRTISGWYHLLPQSIGKLKHIRVQKTLKDDENKENATHPVNSGVRPHFASSARRREVAVGDRSKQIVTDRLKQTIPASDVIKRPRQHVSTPVASRGRIVTSDHTDQVTDRCEVHAENATAVVPLQQRTGNRKRRLLNTIFGCSPAAAAAAAAAAGVVSDRRTPMSGTTRSSTHLQQGKYYKWNPDISVISSASSATATSPERRPAAFVIDDDEDEDEDAMMSASCGTSMTVFVDREDSSNETDQSWKMNGFIESDDDEEKVDLAEESSVNEESSCSSMTEQGSVTDARSTVLSSSKTRENQCRQGNMSGDNTRQRAVRHLAAVEADFAADMAVGIHRYSRPLRCYRAMSSSQHARLFQNVEKLVRLSDYHVSLLSVSDTDVGGAYLPRIAVLCEAYRDYLVGLEAAHRTLQRFERDADFINFLQNNEDDLNADKIASLKTFLDRPSHHIVRLFQRIYDVVVATPNHHSDHWQIKCTAENLLQLCAESSSPIG